MKLFWRYPNSKKKIRKKRVQKKNNRATNSQSYVPYSIVWMFSNNNAAAYTARTAKIQYACVALQYGKLRKMFIRSSDHVDSSIVSTRAKRRCRRRTTCPRPFGIEPTTTHKSRDGRSSRQLYRFNGWCNTVSGMRVHRDVCGAGNAPLGKIRGTVITRKSVPKTCSALWL
jgi:prophage tail gpP-like protein